VSWSYRSNWSTCWWTTNHFSAPGALFNHLPMHFLSCLCQLFLILVLFFQPFWHQNHVWFGFWLQILVTEVKQPTVYWLQYIQQIISILIHVSWHCYCTLIQKAQQMQKDRTMRHKYEISHSKKTAIKHSRSQQLLLLDRLYTSITSCYWPVVTTSLCRNVSDILSIFQCIWLPVTFRSPSPLTIEFKSQATCAFQFMCKHS